MTSYDVTPDDEPLDVRAVGEDDLLVEQLRHALSPDAAVIWDDDDDDIDPAFALLRALQLDVSGNLAAGETILPAGVTELLPRRRRLGRGATIAAVAAGVLSIGGVAAASAPGQPLAGVRHAVSNAVSTAVHAITPEAPVGPAVVPPSTKPTPRGDAVSAAARSASAILQIEANLDRASALLDKGKYEPAKAQLDAASRKLAYVTNAAERSRLQSRLTVLQARLAAQPHGAPSSGKPDGKGKPDGNKGKGGNGGQGGDATHSPKPLPTRAARPSTGPHASDTAPGTVETPKSHQASGS